jgi:hypothetical protein
MLNWMPSGGGTGTACDQEASIVAAVRRGRVPPELEAHCASCESCREVRDVATMMVDFGERTERIAERRRLPEAGQVWWKAQLARRWEAEHTAVAPLDFMQRAEVLVGAVAALTLLLLLVRSLLGLPIAPQELWPSLSSLSVPIGVLAAFLLIAAAVTMHWRLARE